MKISLNWLQNHIDLSDLTVDKISDLLTFAGIEVEEIEHQGIKQDSIVVAKIESSTPHPNADKLSICQVNDGSPELRQIVCGAKNYTVGDCVPLALPGTVFQTQKGELKIKPGELRGETSDGMLCSGSELGLEESSDGLLILSKSTIPGTPLSELFDNDTIFTIEVTPNRPDLLSHRGVARDLSAITNRNLTTEDNLNNPLQFESTGGVSITNNAEEGCPFYTARRFQNVKVQESPDWLKRKLRSIGMRPINNVVDITNFILMETGQPLHAFDVNKIEGGISVEWGKDQKITALDDIEYTLTKDDVVVADSSGKPLAIGGVMGGKDGAVDDNTNNIILESAYFTPRVIRKTSKKLNLSSDSSYRFERGADIKQVEYSSNLAAELLKEIANAEEVSTPVSVGNDKVSNIETIWLPHNSVRELLGVDEDNLSDQQIDTYLTRLGISKSAGDNWTIPSYRNDINRPVDLIEEVTRLHGLENIPSKTEGAFVEPSQADKEYDFTLNIRTKLASLGFQEALTLKLISEKMRDQSLGTGLTALEGVNLKNPMNDEQTLLRPSLIPGLLEVVKRNVSMGSKSFLFFETGTVFTDNEERQNIAFITAGDDSPNDWITPKPESINLHDTLGYLNTLIPNKRITVQSEPSNHYPVFAELKIENQKIGQIAQVTPKLAREELDLNVPVIICELDIATLYLVCSNKTTFQELAKFPAVTRDISMELPQEITSHQISSFFEEQPSDLLSGVDLFDLYQDPSGEKLASDKKALAFKLTYRSDERTLKTKEVDQEHAKIVDSLKEKYPVSIR